jgi:hypothetical protein
MFWQKTPLLVNLGVGEAFDKQNQQVSFRFAEIASWQVGGSSRLSKLDGEPICS